ncbi:MAG: energy-coupling factor ABC transporter ATP-binding protein [Deltaproteobacteria bacterium]|jgi:energy-coupling factor transport system ATP-binding protein|nr:energy-coupling factor ABC transporter ATP-binding protein [Deltaproteobacteria bacterium]
MDPGAILEIKGLGFRFDKDDPWLFRDLNFKIFQNETTLLMGPSGQGKSALALLLSGLYPEYAGISEGSVTCPRGEIKDLSPQVRAKEVSIVFQNPDDQFVMETVEGEVFFALENLAYQGDFRGDYPGRLANILKTVGLAGFEKRKVLSLSGGEKQKLSLATALATEPKLLILDEPLANLDWESRFELARVLEKLSQSRLGLFVIDHQVEPWLGWLDRIMILGQDGPGLTPRMAREHPEIFEKFDLYGPGRWPRSDRKKSNLDRQSFPKKAHPVSDPDGAWSNELAFKAENLTLKRGRSVVWENLSLAAKKGTITAIMGPSGSGKSGLLLALCGLLKIKGHLAVKGRVGLVFQNPGFQFLTQNVLSEIVLSLSPKSAKKLNGQALGLGPGDPEGPDSRADREISDLAATEKTPEDRIVERAKQLAAEFDLAQTLDRSPWQLSQGQQRRLAVLTMLAANVDILFLDEPTYAQDLKATQRIMDLLETQVAKGLTAVMVTHDLDLALAHAHQILTLKDKKLSPFQGADLQTDLGTKLGALLEA